MRKLKNKILNWFRCVSKYGLFNGTSTYWKLYKSSSGKVKPIGFNSPLYFRAKNRFDAYTFYEIFLAEQYNIGFDIKPVTIIDAGANIGFASVYFSRVYPDAKIIAIEPDNENYALLCKNNKDNSNVECVQAALWNDELGVSITNASTSENRGYMVDKTDNAMISSLTVNGIMKAYNLSHIDILKIDIEGAEQEVFEGDTSWLDKVSVVIIELHDRMRPFSSSSFFKSISEHKFLFKMSGENLVFYKSKFS